MSDRLIPGLGRWLLRHPADAVALVSSGWALRRRHWLRQRPHLPVPDPAYWSFRHVTALGEGSAELSVSDVVAAARWSRRQRRRR